MTITRQHVGPTGVRSLAVFSGCERYRYRLSRRWADGPTAVLLAMNPSTADEVDNDPTIERFMRRVHQWGGYGAVEVVNVFAIRETDSTKLPAMVKAGVDIIGPENNHSILDACKGAGTILCGWGTPGSLLNRGKAVTDALTLCDFKLHALSINRDGSPKHPLYVGYAVRPIPYPFTV